MTPYNNRFNLQALANNHHLKEMHMPLEQAAAPTGPANLTDLARLIDGAPPPDAAPQAARLLDLARYLHRILADVHELTGPRSRTPLQNMQEIRAIARAGLREAARLGVLS